MLRPADLLARLSDSLQVLVGGGRDLPDRHRTIRATLEWSYGLLAPPEQALLDRLSVFAGSFSLEGAEAVGDDGAAEPVLDLLGTLVDNSLVRPVDTGIAMRFQLLGTVRDLARERLDERGETAARRDRHAEHTLAAARQARSRLDGPEGTAATAELAADEANHRAAFTHALDRGDADTAAALAVALHPYRVAQGRLQESRDWLSQVLAEAALRDETRAEALVAAGAAAYYQDDLDAAVPLLEDGLAASRKAKEPATVAVALCYLATSLASTGDREAAAPMAVEALELARGADRYEPQVLALSLSAMLAGLAGDTPLETAHHEERLALARRRRRPVPDRRQPQHAGRDRARRGTSGEGRTPGGGGARPGPDGQPHVGPGLAADPGPGGPGPRGRRASPPGPRRGPAAVRRVRPALRAVAVPAGRRRPTAAVAGAPSAPRPCSARRTPSAIPKPKRCSPSSPTWPGTGTGRARPWATTPSRWPAAPDRSWPSTRWSAWRRRRPRVRSAQPPATVRRRPRRP